MRSNVSSLMVDQVHLVDRNTTWRMPSSEQIKECRRVCTSTPLRASTRMMARSAFEAPVAMLRVYCSCPGVSATMNERLRRSEKAIGDVDRDALLALGLQPVDQQGKIDIFADGAVALGVFGERHKLVLKDQLRVVQQPPDQSGLAVVDRAAGDEAEKILGRHAVCGRFSVSEGHQK